MNDECSYSNYSGWREQLARATNKPDAAFWKMDHLDLRTGARQGVVEAMMVEHLWEQLGPLEAKWFADFFPDAQLKYPLEMLHVTPWNAVHANAYFGLRPTFCSASLSSTSIRRLPLEEVAQGWRDLREKHGLATTCWDLVQEMIQAVHLRDALPITQQIPYHANVDPKQMSILQTLCPSDDWALALACAGIGSTQLQKKDVPDRGNHDNWTTKEQQAVAWLQWWLDKSPNCLDNLAWAGIVGKDEFQPNISEDTAILMALSSGAKDPRDTFGLARQLYEEKAPAMQIPTDDFQAVFELK